MHRYRLLAVVAILVSACQTTAPTPGPTGAVPATTAPASTTPPATPSAARPAPSPTLGGPVTARYDDGLPSRRGKTPVFRGQAALDHGALQIDDTSFLVAGWVTYLGQPVSCPLYFGPVTSWNNPCGAARFSDAAGTYDHELSSHVTFRFVLDGPLIGPIVAVAHVHDGRASQCESELDLCDRMLVAERIVWNGDSETEPAPVSRNALVAAIQAAQGISPVAFGRETANPGCELPGLYLYAVPTPDDVAPMVTCAVMAPTIEARTRGLDRPDGVAAALRPKAVLMESRSWLHSVLTAHVTYRWLVVQNVVLLVRTEAEPTAKDKRFLQDLVDALEP